MNAKAATVIQWATIIISAVCCPILLTIAICMCVIKRKERVLNEELAKRRIGADFTPGNNDGLSSDSEVMDEITRIEDRRRQQQARLMAETVANRSLTKTRVEEVAQLKLKSNQRQDDLRDISASSGQTSSSYVSESRDDISESESSNEEPGAAVVAKAASSHYTTPLKAQGSIPKVKIGTMQPADSTLSSQRRSFAGSAMDT